MKFSVDRVEGARAVLISCEDEKIVFTLPLVLLPGIRESDIIDMTFDRDEAATRETKNNNRDMIERLKKYPE